MVVLLPPDPKDDLDLGVLPPWLLLIALLLALGFALGFTWYFDKILDSL